MLELEEEKLSDQRARLAAMKREAKLKELKSLDDARQKYLQQQQTLRELEIEKMDKEIEKKVKFAKKKLACACTLHVKPSTCTRFSTKHEKAANKIVHGVHGFWSNF